MNRRHLRDPSLYMVLAALAGLTLTNAGAGLDSLWQQEVSGASLATIVVDGLMTAFFLAVGIEIRREITGGTLRSPRAALTPVICAAAGMAVPALLFATVARGSPGASGWAIPTATDAALAVGALALLAPGLSPGARAFLLTLAVADDIGGVLIICLWFTPHAAFAPALGAIALAVVAAFAVASGRVPPALALGLIIPAWALMHAAGLTPAIIGAVFGLLVPLPEHSQPLVRRLEWLVAILVLPLFALVSASVPIALGAIDRRVAFGAVLGLCLGKPLGIFGALSGLSRLGLGSHPEGSNRRELFGVAILGGVGFTVALYISDLSLPGVALRHSAALGVLLGSALATILGAVYFRVIAAGAPRPPQLEEPRAHAAVR